jgi:CBS-domain-containing membrane protein
MGRRKSAREGQAQEQHADTAGISTLMLLLKKMKGDGASLPPQPALKAVALAWLGGFLAIAAVALLADALSVAMVLGSFGATCVLLFGYPDVPFSQPRNVIAGHFISSLIGLIFLTTFGTHWWSVSLSVGTAIAVMMLTRTVHPPAGSNPVIVFLTQPSWAFLLLPTLAGAIIVVAVALLYNNSTRDARYPKYW